MRKEMVALKVEKADKSKRILETEYKILCELQGLPHICPVYEFIESNQANVCSFIVMKLLGKNLSTLKKQKGKKFTPVYALNLLIQMLDAIESVHNKGYIHRDIKPSNFVIDECMQNQVYLVDFGLGKLHLDKDGRAVGARKNMDFRGTVAYASLNAHNKLDLSRRDDMWGWYFMLLDFLNESLPWRSAKANRMDEVKDIKVQCLADPEQHLWRTYTRSIVEVKNIFYKIKELQFPDKPDYSFIRKQLQSFLQKEEGYTIPPFVEENNSFSRKRKAPTVAANSPEERQLPTNISPRIENGNYTFPQMPLICNPSFFSFLDYFSLLQFPYYPNPNFPIMYTLPPPINYRDEELLTNHFPFPFPFYQPPIIPGYGYNAGEETPQMGLFRAEANRGFCPNS